MAPIYGTAFLAIRPDLEKFGSELSQGVQSTLQQIMPGAGGGPLGNIAKNFGANLGVVMGVGMVAAAGVALEKLGATFDDAYDKIRITTGKTGEELSALQGDFREVFTSIPTDAAAASSAIADLNQLLGVTGEPLQNLSKQFLELSRLTGTDLRGNIDSIGKAFNAWQIDPVRDASGALDNLFRATQISGVEINKLGEELRRFQVPLSKMGFGFAEATALLAGLDKAGANVPQIMMGLNIAMANAAKSGETAADAFRRVIAEIGAAGTEAEATSAAVSLFGQRAGPQLATLIKSGRLSIEDLTAAIGGGTETILGAAEETNDWREDLKILMNEVMVKLAPLAEKLFSGIGDAIEKIDFDKVIGFFDDLGRGLGTVFDVAGLLPGLFTRGGAALKDFSRNMAVRTQVQGFTDDLKEGGDAVSGFQNRLAELGRGIVLDADAIEQLGEVANLSGADAARAIAQVIERAGELGLAADDVDALRTAFWGMTEAVLPTPPLVQHTAAAMAELTTTAAPAVSAVQGLIDAAIGADVPMGDLVTEINETGTAMGMAITPADALTLKLQLLEDGALTAAQAFGEGIEPATTDMKDALNDLNEDGAVSIAEFTANLRDATAAALDYKVNLAKIATISPELAAALANLPDEAQAKLLAAGFAEATVEEVMLAAEALTGTPNQMSDALQEIYAEAVNSLDFTDPASVSTWLSNVSGILESIQPGATEQFLEGFQTYMDDAASDVVPPDLSDQIEAMFSQPEAAKVGADMTGLAFAQETSAYLAGSEADLRARVQPPVQKGYSGIDLSLQGRSAADGFIGAMIAQVQSEATARALRAAVRRAMDAALLAGSPSRVFMDYGTLAAESFWSAFPQVEAETFDFGADADRFGVIGRDMGESFWDGFGEAGVPRLAPGVDLSSDIGAPLLSETRGEAAATSVVITLESERLAEFVVDWQARRIRQTSRAMSPLSGRSIT